MYDVRTLEMISVGSKSFQLFCLEACLPAHTHTMISQGPNVFQMLRNMQMGPMMMPFMAGTGASLPNLQLAENPQSQGILPMASVNPDQGAVPQHGPQHGVHGVSIHGAVPQGSAQQGAVPQQGSLPQAVPFHGAVPQAMVPIDESHSNQRSRRSRRHRSSYDESRSRDRSVRSTRRRRGRGPRGRDRSGSAESFDLNQISLKPTSYLTRSFVTSDNIPSNCLMVRKLPRAT